MLASKLVASIFQQARGYLALLAAAVELAGSKLGLVRLACLGWLGLVGLRRWLGCLTWLGCLAWLPGLAWPGLPSWLNCLAGYPVRKASELTSSVSQQPSSPARRESLVMAQQQRVGVKQTDVEQTTVEFVQRI